MLEKSQYCKQGQYFNKLQESLYFLSTLLGTHFGSSCIVVCRPCILTSAQRFQAKKQQTRIWPSC